MSRLLIAASGTGGHLFPALAVADALPRSWDVSWLGVPDRLETTLVPQHYRMTTVRAGGLQGRGLRKIIQLIQLLAATLKVRRLIQKDDCKVVFTTGGYIAAPAILAAKWCGKPILLHESNVIPGRVTRLLGRLCNVVAIGLPNAAERVPGCRTVLTGTPVRDSFLNPQALPTWVPQGEGPLLVVMGGSQGAVGLNKMVRAVVPELLSQGCRVVHLTGRNDPDVQTLSHPNLVERPFSDEIPGLLQHADLSISRSGAGSLSELAISGTPAILVPYPQAADQHQDANAASAAELGAAVIVHQHPPEDPGLKTTVQRLLRHHLNGTSRQVEGSASQDGKNMRFNDDPLRLMRQGMEQMAMPDAQHDLVKLLEGISR